MWKVLVVALFGLCVEATTATTTATTRNCRIEDYYYAKVGPNPLQWTREALMDLVISSHEEIIPFYSSEPGAGDVLGALMELDAARDDDGTGGFFSNAMSVRLFYVDQNVPQYPVDRSIWVPEHIRPVFQSSVPRSDFDAAYSDLHNIRPVHPLLHEADRGTTYFGVCSNCNDLVFEGSDACTCGDFFQPPVSARGTVARAILYMQLRYPDLEISNCHIEQLLAWHAKYPPSRIERDRNAHICNGWQGNRNPFVDFPELAFSTDVMESNCEASVSDGSSSPPIVFEDEFSGRVDDALDPTPCESGRRKGLRCYTPGAQFNSGTPVSDRTSDSDIDEDQEDNVFRPSQSEDICSNMQAGDIYFYVLQSVPSRIGMIPLVDLPEGLELYLTDTLSFSKPLTARRSTISLRVDESVPETLMMRMVFDEGLGSGNAFGLGKNMMLGDQWEIVSSKNTDVAEVEESPLVVRGDAYGGDEFFLFCKQNNEDIKLLSAITTNGSFREQGDISWLARPGFGRVVLEEPFDYWLYNGPHFGQNDSYQRALMSSDYWMGFNSGQQQPSLEEDVDQDEDLETFIESGQIVSVSSNESEEFSSATITAAQGRIRWTTWIVGSSLLCVFLFGNALVV